VNIGLAVALVGLLLATPVLAAEDSEAAAGRIEVIEGNHGYVIAVFPSGRLVINVGQRELGHYRVGDEIRIDGAGRPLPPR
jgi:hypothetical protein